MDLSRFLRSIRKYWWIVVLVTLLGASLGILTNARATPLYASRVTFFVSTPSDGGGSNTQFNADQFAQRRANSYAKVLSSQALGELIIAKTHVDLTANQVAAKIKGSVDLNTVLLTARVVDTSSARSLVIATAVSTEFGRLVASLDNTGTGNAVKLNVVSGPTANTHPFSPRRSVNIGGGILIGLILGVILAGVRELFDTTVRTSDALAALTKLPVIGSIGYDAGARRVPVIAEGQTRSLRAEAFRQLRTNLQFIDAANPVQVIVVTSSTASEGKSSSAANLAVVSAETGLKVLLIEADMRRPRVADYLGIERAIGLSNILAGLVSLDEVIQKWGVNGLSVLPSGTIPPNPSELLGSAGMAELVTKLRSRFDMIVVDTPPILPVTDAAVASVFADGVVLIVRYGRTTRAQVSASVNAMDSVGARVLGCVLNMRPNRRPLQGRYDGYGYYEESQNSSWPPTKAKLFRKSSKPGQERAPHEAGRATVGVGASAKAGQNTSHVTNDAMPRQGRRARRAAKVAGRRP